MIDNFPKVEGECPMGCGQTLFLGSGGYVTCSWMKCPQPDSASRMLETSTSIRKVFEKHGIGSS